MIELQKFIEVSETLTGVAHLDPALAGEYLQLLSATTEAKALPTLVEELDRIAAADGDTDTAISTLMREHGDLRDLCKVLILLWYLGELHGEKSEAGHPSHYFQALLWKVIHAHPPGLSGGYFGHWAYPPDN
jgi:hypothetical protein